MIRLRSAGATDVGLWRSNNEDSYLIMPEAGVFALADGMGGAAAGEIASQYFIETVRDVFRSRNDKPMTSVHASVQKAFKLANKRILAHTARHPDDEGMGCTGELLVLSGDRYVIGHVGDSRIYLLRDNGLRQLTKDHSLVQSQVDDGTLTAEEAKHHPRKNILLRAVGTDLTETCDIVEGYVLNRDIFLLCSDGLTDMVEDSAILKAVASFHAPEDTVKNLVSAALTAGGKDNVTVVLCAAEIA